MPLYDPRWAEDATAIAEPSGVEKADGLPCGSEGLRETFNWLFWDLQGNLNVLWARTITTPATGGLSGGGDLSADRSLTTNWTGLTAQSGLANDDLFNIRDVSAGVQVKMTLGELKDNILTDVEDLSEREINTGKGLAGGGDLSADRTIITDWTANLTVMAAIEGGDLFNVRDISAAAGAGDQRSATADVVADYIIGRFIDEFVDTPGSEAILNPDVLLVEATRPVGAPMRSMTSSFQAWRLNSIEKNDIAGASVHPTTYYITLPAGKYHARYAGVASWAISHQIRLYNRTASAELGHGLTQNSQNELIGTNASIGETSFELSVESEISLDHVARDSGGLAGFGDNTDAYVRYDAFIRIERIKGTA